MVTAEVHKREKHVVRYKPDFPAVQHLILHELIHLEFVIEARKSGNNLLFTSTSEQKSNFQKEMISKLNKSNRERFQNLDLDHFCNILFEGMNLQIYNTPIDLFIESQIHTNFKSLRPFQFLSLYSMILNGIHAVTDEKVLELTPKELVSKSKILNLVNAIQFKDIYGIDLIDEFNASNHESSIARRFYNEFQCMREKRKPGEEYELIFRWAKELKLEKYFQLIHEPILSEKEVETKQDFQQEKDMFLFQKSQEEIGTNMAVVMYMVGALQYFKDKSKEEIKAIAFDISMQGRNGYDPERKDYLLPSIPGKLYTGFQILAYYYVSWKLAIPEMVSQLQLPYADEFKIASAMVQKDG